VRNTGHEALLYVIFFSLLPLRPKYIPQQPILEHPQTMFVP